MPRLLVVGLVTAGLTLASGLSSIAVMAQTGAAITVTGTLTEEGVPCRAMRGDDGVLYTFRRTALTSSFRPGDRITVEGRITPVSICQQGTTIVVTRAEPAR